MKKKLEAELISIAHRILKLKNKSELVQLHQETQKLYEKLSVLRFVEENFADAKPTIGYKEVVEKMEVSPDVEEAATEIIPAAEAVIEADVPEEEVAEAEIAQTIAAQKEEAIEEPEEAEQAAEPDVEEPETTAETPAEEDEQEETTGKPAFTPLFEIAEEEEESEAATGSVEKLETKQITLEDLLGNVHPDPIFVRAEEVFTNETTTAKTSPDREEEVITQVETISRKTEFIGDLSAKSPSLNDMLSKGINIGLNDRIGFEKHLFGGSGEDLNRVLSQLSTFDTFEEASDFIEDMVRPDYNNWDGKDEYATRFMELVAKKFS